MKKRKIFEIIIAFLTGFISGFFGAGGGLLLVPFFVHFLKVDNIKARANAILIILTFVIISGFIYLKNGFIDYSLSLKCALGGIIGSIIGSKILVSINKKILDLLFIIFLIYSGLKIIL